MNPEAASRIGARIRPLGYRQPAIEVFQLRSINRTGVRLQRWSRALKLGRRSHAVPAQVGPDRSRRKSEVGESQDAPVSLFVFISTLPRQTERLRTERRRGLSGSELVKVLPPRRLEVVPLL
jgi:hypothetical protein